MTLQDILAPLGVFALITLVNLVFAMRLILTTRRRRLLSAVLAFVEAFTFITSLAQVTADLSQLDMLLAYCLGAAVGGWLGMLIEERLISGYVRLNITAPQDGVHLASALRERGYGATVIVGTGMMGNPVHLIETVASRRHSHDLIEFIRQQQPNAFLTVEESRSVHQGWIPVARRFF